MFKRIVVPIDGSECAGYALDLAIDLAKRQGARLAICSVVDPIVVTGTAPPSPALDVVIADMENEARKRVAEAVRRAEQAGVGAHGEMVMGVPFNEILRYAHDCEADAIVMGTHGRTGLQRFFLGSVAEMVLRKAACPVIVARDSLHGRDASRS